jgi:regulator of protease activity HflC (stomatin/prohibitin superfamily)
MRLLMMRKSIKRRLKNNNMTKKLTRNKKVAITLGILLLIVGGIGYFGVYRRSKVVPPGTTILVIKPSGKTVVHNQGAYYAFGRDRVYYVDRKLKTYQEEMNILCQDKINMSVDVKWIGSFRINEEAMETIKQKVPSIEGKFEGMRVFHLSLDRFYADAIQPIVRQKARVTISKYTTDIIPENREKIQEALRSAVVARLGELKYPVETSDVIVSNMDFPPEVTTHREQIKKAQLENERLAAQADAKVQEAKRQAQLAREEGKAEMERAKATSEANKILGETYKQYPELLVKQQWETLKKLAESENTVIVVMPYEALQSGATDAALMRELVGNKLQETASE